MKLHHYAHSSASHRVRIALAIKAIDVEYQTVDMAKLEQQSAEYAALNSQALVPCMELDDGSIIGQSLAIIDYLEREYPESPLYPGDPVARAQAQSLTLMIACETAPIQAFVVQRYLQSEYAFDDKQVNQWLTHWIHRGLAPVEKHLQTRQTQSTYTMGPVPGIVDLFVIPQLLNADRWRVDVSNFSAAMKLNDACFSHPAFQAAHPKRWA